MSFSADVADWAKNTAPQSLERVVRRTLIEIHARADSRSPVGDAKYWQNPDSAPAGYAGGQFRGNWQYGFGTPPIGDIDRIDPSGAATRAEFDASITGQIGVHCIVNNLPYAQRIEEGHSWNQAPRGIVGLIRMELPDIVRIAQQ